MVSYELAKRLAAAGFPQEACHFYYSHHTTMPTYWCINALTQQNVEERYEPYAAPRTGELIEELGDKFYSLTKKKHGFEAMSRADDEDMHHVATAVAADEALAMLWLALNENLG